MQPRAAAVRVHLMPWIVAGIIAAVVGIGLMAYFAVRVAARWSASAATERNAVPIRSAALKGTESIASEPVGTELSVRCPQVFVPACCPDPKEAGIEKGLG